MENKFNCILLVDDDEGHNYLTQAVIEDAGVATHIRTAWNGREAIDYLASQGKYKERGADPRPELILLDINMPVMNGWDFMAEYCKLGEAQKRGVMIVMLTTSANPDDRERARTVPGISDFRSKPLTPEALEEVVRKYFKERTSG